MKATARVILLLAFSGLSAYYPTSSQSYPEYSDEFEDGWATYATSAETYSEYTYSENEYVAGEYGEKTEGDLILSRKQREYLDTEPPKGITSKSVAWPDGRVFYVIHDVHFNAGYKKYILQAMQQIEEVSCIRFYEAYDFADEYINITGFRDNCYAEVGKTGYAQSLNLQPDVLNTGCFRLGTIVHELLHALGFFHQNNVSNRDKYVKIEEDNIDYYKGRNFYRYQTSYVVDFDVCYDYDSILHFHSKAFSKNGNATIIPIGSDAAIGQREGMSIRDIVKLNLMYDCTISSEKLEQFAMVLCEKYKGDCK